MCAVGRVGTLAKTTFDISAAHLVYGEPGGGVGELADQGGRDAVIQGQEPLGPGGEGGFILLGEECTL